MRRRDMLEGAGVLLFLSTVRRIDATVAESQAMEEPQSVSLHPREVLSLNRDWRFFEGDILFPRISDGVGTDDTYDSTGAGNAAGAAAGAYDDSKWARLDVPHDFVSFQAIERSENAAQGYRRRGIAWYRRKIRLDHSDHGKHIELQFDGVATHATIWFNGILVCQNWSGYNSFYIDVTPYATYGDALNTLSVRVDAQAMEGWWYEGGGIYRNVWIVKREPTHIITDGVFAHPVMVQGQWTIPVEVTLYTSALDTQEVIITSELWNGEILLTRSDVMAQVASLQNAVARLTLHYGVPHLWDVNDPYLYRVVTRVEQSGQVLDKVTTQCGFRTQRFDPEKGFFLNDKHVKLQGVCLHQDHAGVGIAVPAGLVGYRLRRLKELGCNAIRCAHNAQNSVLLDACDQMGFLVMEENRNFNASPDYLAQLKWMVRRDRNHPSIIMWSIFNEEPLQGTEEGYEMARRLRAGVHELDISRAVTGAMNGGHFKPVNVSQILDVVGFNYIQDQYDAFHREHPQIPLTSSEDTSTLMTRGEYSTDKVRHLVSAYDDDPAEGGETHRQAWKAIAERDYIAGGFVWTGFDYHGEPSPFRWPSNSSFFGIMDLCGFEKTAFYIHQAHWVRNRPVLWLVPHWNWQGQEGQPIMVMACSNLHEVELCLNGGSRGRQRVDIYNMNRWMVPYAPGRLDLIGYSDGKVVARAHVETTGPASALRLTSDRAKMNGDGWDAQPIRIEAVDGNGRFVPSAQNMITIDIEGGEIIGLGNGDPNSLEPEKGNRRSLFNGLAQVIVRSVDHSHGVLKITAKAAGLKSASVAVVILQAAPPAYQS